MRADEQREPRAAPAGGARRGRLLFWSLFGALVAVAAWLLFWPRGTPQVPQNGSQDQTSQGLAMRAVTLYFGDDEARTLLAERREVPTGNTLEARVEACMLALVEGPDQQGAVRTLPTGARLRQAFFDDETATLYLDFDPTLVTSHPGGSAAEYSTLGSIVRTIGSNFPEVARLQLLVDGQPIESLAGHFDTSKPIEISSWR